MQPQFYRNIPLPAPITVAREPHYKGGTIERWVARCACGDSCDKLNHRAVLADPERVSFCAHPQTGEPCVLMSTLRWRPTSHAKAPAFNLNKVEVTPAMLLGVMGVEVVELDAAKGPLLPLHLLPFFVRAWAKCPLIEADRETQTIRLTDKGRAVLRELQPVEEPVEEPAPTLARVLEDALPMVVELQAKTEKRERKLHADDGPFGEQAARHRYDVAKARELALLADLTSAMVDRMATLDGDRHPASFSRFRAEASLGRDAARETKAQVRDEGAQLLARIEGLLARLGGGLAVLSDEPVRNKKRRVQ